MLARRPPPLVACLVAPVPPAPSPFPPLPKGGQGGFSTPARSGVPAFFPRKMKTGHRK
jgi:hypothetical protein